MPKRRGRPFLPVLLGAAIVASGCEKADRRESAAEAPAVAGDLPIVLVLIDAMRADRFSMKDGDLATTPNIARLARDGVVFRNAFSSAPKTIPSVPQIFTSRYFPDIQHAVTMMSVCKDAGYQRTGAFIHNPYVKKWLGRMEPTFDDLGGGDFDAARLTDDAIAWLSRRTGDRVALYVHYLDVHVPLRPPARIASRFVDPAYSGPIGLEFGDTQGAWAGRYDAADKKRIGDLYDATVAATDEQVGRLFDALRAEGLYDRALVIVTADHGEELWEHGGFFHGHTLYDELLRVPLVVKFPGSWRAGENIDGLAATVDILPTITGLLARGDVRERAKSDGQSLVSLVRSQPVARTVFATIGRVEDRSAPLYAVRSRTAKLIYDVRDGSEMLFDLAVDPAERENLAAKPEATALLSTMRAELARHSASLVDTGFHARLSNGTGAPIHYRMEVGVDPIAPLANFARFKMEAGDRIGQRPNGDGMTVEGVLDAGDEDEVRFDALRTDGAITPTLNITEPVPIEICAAEEACAAGGQGRIVLPMERLHAAARPSRTGTSSVRIEWWYRPGETEPILPFLTPADRERLRALGYAE